MERKSVIKQGQTRCVKDFTFPFRGNQTEHHISSRYSKGRSRRETSENFAIEIERKGEREGYLDSARARREEEAPWFTGDEDEDEDQ